MGKEIASSSEPRALIPGSPHRSVRCLQANVGNFCPGREPFKCAHFHHAEKITDWSRGVDQKKKIKIKIKIKSWLMCDNSTLKRPPRFIIESVVFESLRYFYCLSLGNHIIFPRKIYCYSYSFVCIPRIIVYPLVTAIFMVMLYLYLTAPQTVSAPSWPPQSSILTVEHIHLSQQPAMQIQSQTYKTSA